ncbi:MAG TPA: hypothetical protein VM165_20340 [Planctomycetaceae bacterium]|nr:hypothetical protein [Planctomycetaceae bacterium]
MSDHNEPQFAELSLEDLEQVQGGIGEPVLLSDEKSAPAICHGVTVLAWARV